MIVGIHHIGVSVADLGAASAMLQAGLALEEAARFEATDTPEVRALFQLDGVKAQVAMLRGPNVFLELFQFRDPPPHRQSCAIQTMPASPMRACSQAAANI
jgi:catechol 2,3-dioxygenase-like lactoylglutathione lyase family enzyme